MLGRDQSAGGRGGSSRRSARAAGHRWCGCPARATPSAPTSTAPASGCSASPTSPPARPWTSRGSGSSGCSCSSTTGCSTTWPTSTRSPPRPSRAWRDSPTCPSPTCSAPSTTRGPGRCSRVLVGLGIRHLGQVGSLALARALGDDRRHHGGRRGQPGRGRRGRPGHRRQRGPLVRLGRSTGRWSSGSDRPACQPDRAGRGHRPSAYRCWPRPWRASRWWSPAPSRATPGRRPRRPSWPGGQVAGVGVEEDLCPGGGGVTRRLQGDQGRATRRCNHRRRRVRRPAPDGPIAGLSGYFTKI